MEFLYGEQTAASLWPQFNALLTEYRTSLPEFQQASASPQERLTERDVFLITYADQFTSAKDSSLACLQEFLDKDLAKALSGVHILPFYPYSSDDGFSVIDYFQVDPRHGSWEDIVSMGKHYRLMFDAVINHISKESDWFQGYLAGEDIHEDYFIEANSKDDLSQVVRPRALPLLTSFETARGPRQVWTTFGPDQIDLNYANPQLLLEIVQLLLFYVAKGAEVIRLDAIAYLWKELGTSSIHLPQTHSVIKLFRSVLDELAPHVILITETNVPHEDNISYFGAALDGSDHFDEAQMVYQFPLAPIVLHTFIQEDASVLSSWAASLGTPSPSTTFFNFIASHDGIGLMPAKGLLADEEIHAIVERTLAHGGHASNKSNADGTESVYELNITLYDALNDPKQPNAQIDIQRFLASQAIMLALAGVPGIYAHSLFGSRNCHSCVEETDRPRSINRKKFDIITLRQTLSDPMSVASRISGRYLQLIELRKAYAAFHPNASQHILELSPSVFAVLRRSVDKKQSILAITNVSKQAVDLDVPVNVLGLGNGIAWKDLVLEQVVQVQGGKIPIDLQPYQFIWLFTED